MPKNRIRAWLAVVSTIVVAACAYRPFGSPVTNPARPDASPGGVVTNPASPVGNASETNPAKANGGATDPSTNPARPSSYTNPAQN